MHFAPVLHRETDDVSRTTDDDDGLRSTDFAIQRSCYCSMRLNDVAAWLRRRRAFGGFETKGELLLSGVGREAERSLGA